MCLLVLEGRSICIYLTCIHPFFISQVVKELSTVSGGTF
jgi:hypothetical protein